MSLETHLAPLARDEKLNTIIKLAIMAVEDRAAVF